MRWVLVIKGAFSTILPSSKYLQLLEAFLVPFSSLGQDLSFALKFDFIITLLTPYNNKTVLDKKTAKLAILFSTFTLGGSVLVIRTQPNR